MAAAGAAVSCACALCPVVKSGGLRSFAPQGLATVRGCGLRIRGEAEGFGGEGGVRGDFRVARVLDGAQLRSGFSTNVVMSPAPVVEVELELVDELQVELSFGDGGSVSSGGSSISSSSGGGVIDSRERMRRERIGQANKGKVPWNKGRRHSPETIAKIKERTKLAMLNPEIRDKLRQCGKNQSKETKAKIREKMVGYWESKRTIKEAQNRCVTDWKEIVAEAARVGGSEDEEYEWDSYKNIKLQFKLEALEAKRRKKEVSKVRVKVARSRRPVSDAHRKAISDAIKAKWADPTYQKRVSAGMARTVPDRKQRDPEKKRVRVLSSPKRKAATTKSSSTVDYFEDIQVEKKKPVQVDEDFIAEVLAEEVTLQTKSERSTAARKNGPRKVTLVSLEDHDLSSKDVSEADSEDESAKQEEVALLEGTKTSEDTDVKPQSLRPDGVQLSSKLTSHKDPFVLEKVQRIQQLRKGRLEVEMKRKEAADRARMLIADAERAASALEQAGKIDAATMAKLIETRKLLAEATRSMQAAEKKQGASLGKARNLETQKTEKPLSLSTSGDFHSRIWGSGDNIADCPHPIPIRIGSMRSIEEHQLHLNQLGGNSSSSSRSSRWATSRSDLVEGISEEETQSPPARGIEESQAGRKSDKSRNSEDGNNGLAARGSSKRSNRRKPVWHNGRFSLGDEDERT